MEEFNFLAISLPHPCSSYMLHIVEEDPEEGIRYTMLEDS